MFFFIFIRHIGKSIHKTKIYNYCTYTKIITKKSFFFSFIYKNERKKTINFNDKKIKKSDFYKRNKKIFNIDDIDVNEILVFKKEQYGKNNSFIYFIGYNDNDVIRPLYLKLSQMTGYINKFEKKKKKCLLWLKINSF